MNMTMEEDEVEKPVDRIGQEPEAIGERRIKWYVLRELWDKNRRSR